MRNILIGVAGVALIATSAAADPGKGQGGGNSEKGGRDRGGAQVSADGRADNGKGKGDRDQAKAGARAKAEVRVSAQRPERRDNDKRDQQSVRWDKDGRDRDDRYEARDRDDRNERGENDGRRTVRDARFIDRDDYVRTRTFIRDDNRRTLINGCPPGLAKKGNGCMPPGLAKRGQREYFRYDWQPRLFGMRNYERANYVYRDGYLLRLGANNLVSGYIPLLGGALAVGNPWPSTYRSLTLPQYYVDYYGLGAANTYRYADNVVYRVDPTAAAITSVAALLTGNDINIGQPMPLGYDVYNVPLAYRDRYYDTPDAMYRYSDGYVYRIDPTTQLVAAAINLLV